MAIAWIILAQFVCVQLAAGALKNVALGKPVNMSSQYKNHVATRAVDGNKGENGVIDEFNAMHTDVKKEFAWWWVDLQSQVQDATVLIYFRTNYKVRRNGVKLYTSSTPFKTFPGRDLCHTVTGRRDGEDIPNVVSVNCSGPWQYLMVYTNTDNSEQGDGAVLDFGEVEVLSCTPGTYGANCIKFCSSRQCSGTSTSCDRYTGACTGGCEAGWMGTDCMQGCNPGTYGANCIKFCSSRYCSGTSTSCDRYTGACTGGCEAGWMGTDCMQGCNPGTYGANCNKSCSSRHCSGTSTSCDRYTGACTGGCEAGWMVADCLQECQSDTYGVNCKNSCSDRKCKSRFSQCNRETGLCPDGCQDGWRGDDCTSQCPKGSFGLDCRSCSTRHCQGESDCSGDGTCSGGCQDGWTLNNCTQACPDGTFGHMCNFTCGNCTGDKICNHTTGSCPGGCKTGWQGNQCKQVCHNTYGTNCAEPCGRCIGTCISTDGQCPNGCEEGYSGPQCKLKNTDIKPIVAGIVAGVVIIIIVVIVIFVFKRRRSSSKNSLKTDNQCHEAVKGSSDRKGSSEGGNMYVNVAYVENEAKKEKPPLLKKPKPANKPNNAPAEILIPDQEEEIVEEDKPSSQKGEYYNLGEDVIREIPVAELADTIQKIKHRKGGFEAEYDRLPIGFTALYDDSQRPENAGKNKFRGYYPYDHNRVRLSLIPNIPGSDYINASLMHSYDQKKTYIAAQAPNKKTVGDFWRMIWEHRCNRVIMLTGLVEAAKVKCYKYWPDEDALETDQHKVEVEVTDIRANYTIRHLKVTSKDKGECRSIVQYHFTSWPDHGVPDTLALVHFIWMIRRTDTETDGPLLVHCSAGIGRTGTYIAVDSLLDQARAEGMVNVHGYVSVMRGQRKNMIQTKEQYECVFHCLVEMTTFGNTSMDVGTFAASYSSRGMNNMVDRKTIRELTQMATTEERCDQPERHKMWVDGNHDYTVRVGPTLRNVRGYMQTNAPPSGQEKLLWKLVEQNDVHNVVAISPLQVNLFGEKGTTMTYGDVTLKTTDMTSLTSDLTMATLQLHVTDGGTFQNVKLFKFSGSPTMDSMSSHLLDQADLQHLSLELSRVVLIHSESDRKFAILFCIMDNILSGMMEDRRVDVIGHVRTFLKCCPDVTFTEQDVEKLHVFAQKCVQMTDTSNTYANL